jgi:hypothetical protein
MDEVKVAASIKIRFNEFPRRRSVTSSASFPACNRRSLSPDEFSLNRSSIAKFRAFSPDNSSESTSNSVATDGRVDNAQRRQKVSNLIAARII